MPVRQFQTLQASGSRVFRAKVKRSSWFIGLQSVLLNQMMIFTSLDVNIAVDHSEM